MKIIDITHDLSETTCGFPIEPTPEFTTICDIDKNCPVQVNKIILSTHAGTHVDAPRHYHKEGISIDKLPLEPFIGACIVIDVSHIESYYLEVSDIEHLELRPRVLFKTNSSAMQHLSLSKACVNYLGEREVILIGTDTISIDAMTSKDLPAHHACHAYSIQIMEFLKLSTVSPGFYTLIGFPLKLTGLDASPVRAVLLPEGTYS
ncbi:MAG: cyclase family protein [Legionellaceae bacterium]|nr:cyclase family protein [Legionellaceae bacterium]